MILGQLLAGLREHSLKLDEGRHRQHEQYVCLHGRCKLNDGVASRVATDFAVSRLVLVLSAFQACKSGSFQATRGEAAVLPIAKFFTRLREQGRSCRPQPPFWGGASVSSLK